MKKLFQVLVSIMGLSAGTASAMPVLIEGIYYELSNGKAIVTNNGDPYMSYQVPFVEIPYTVNYEGNSYYVEEIGAGAFSMSPVMEVMLPPTITTIGAEAFRYCNNLRYVSNLENVRIIGESAFEWCENMEIPGLPPSLTMIGSGAFSGCKLPETLMIPSRLYEIMPGAFSGTSVRMFEVDASNDCYASLDGILCSKDMKTLVMMPPALDMDSYTVSSNFNKIEPYAFAGSSLKKIVVNDNITSIGAYAFKSCYNLTEISLPSTIKEIPTYMLSSCRSLKTLTLPEGVESIGQYAISWCDSLSVVNFPSSLRRIEWCGFYRTDGLVDLVLPEGLEYLGSSSFSQCYNLETVYIPSSVKEIPYSPFSGCDKLRRITVSPDNKKFISLWGFLYSKNLETLYQVTPVSTFATVMEGTTQIMEMAGWGCKKLEKLTLPSTLQVVRDLAFGFCDNLNEVYCAATVPPRFSSDRCFNGVANRDNCTLYVPLGCKGAYESSAWNVFVNIEEYNPENSTFLPAEVYLTGNFNGWECPLYNKDPKYVLKRVGSDMLLYAGIIDIEDGEFDFKIFERPTDWEDKLGFWGADGDFSKSGYSYTIKLGAGSNYGNISLSDWSGKRVELVLNINRQTLTITAIPDSPVLTFVETDKIESGGKYVIAYGDRIVRPLPENATYGYLPALTADSIGEGICKTIEANAFTITEKDGNYTIKGSDNRYYYMMGSYDNFNVSTTLPETGGLWKISFNEDNDVKIVNLYNDKLFVYSKNYHNYAAYSNFYNGSNALPKLYKLDDGSSVEEIESTAAEDAEVEYYNLQGVKVENPGSGIYIRRQGSKSSKVMIKD